MEEVRTESGRLAIMRILVPVRIIQTAHMRHRFIGRQEKEGRRRGFHLRTALNHDIQAEQLLCALRGCIQVTATGTAQSTQCEQYTKAKAY